LRQANGLLPRRHVAQFVSKQAGQFVFVAQERDHLARDVHPASGHSERLNFRSVIQNKLVVQTGVRQLAGYSRAHRLHIAGQGLFVDHQKILLGLLAHEFAELHFLSAAENIRAWWDCRRQARTRCLWESGRRKKQHGEQQKTWSHGKLPLLCG
jgi:hypothetical protein